MPVHHKTVNEAGPNPLENAAYDSPGGRTIHRVSGKPAS